MHEIGLEFIGTALTRLQTEIRELKLAMRFDREEAITRRDSIGAEIATLHARIDAFDQRFEHHDELIGNLRQEMQDRFSRMEARFDRLEALLASRT